MQDRTYTLHALVMSDTPEDALVRLLDYCDEALVEYKMVELPHYQTGEAQTRYQLVLRPGALRNTQAHGVACAFGFVAWIS